MRNLESIVAFLILVVAATVMWANAFLEMYRKKNRYPLCDCREYTTTWVATATTMVLTLVDIFLLFSDHWLWARIAFCLTVWAAVPFYAKIKANPYDEAVTVTGQKLTTILICGLVLTFTCFVAGFSYPT